MPEKESLAIVWTERAVQNSLLITKYLKKEFTQKEVESFHSLLIAFEESVSVFPKLYPLSNKKKEIRRAVLSKLLSVFYRIKPDSIEVLAILDNRCDISEWL